MFVTVDGQNILSLEQRAKQNSPRDHNNETQNYKTLHHAGFIKSIEIRISLSETHVKILQLVASLQNKPSL